MSQHSIGGDAVARGCSHNHTMTTTPTRHSQQTRESRRPGLYPHPPMARCKTQTLADAIAGSRTGLSLAQRAARAGKRRRKPHRLPTFRDGTQVRARQRKDGDQVRARQQGTERSGPLPRSGKLLSEEGQRGSSLQCHQDAMSDLVQPHPRTPTAQSKSPKRVRKHSSTCPKCRPLRPGELVPNLVGRAQAPLLHLEWSAAGPLALWKQDGRVPGRRLQDHSRRALQCASVNLGRKSRSRTRDCVCVWQGGSGTRDERTMTCMQLMFLSPSPVDLARPIRPLASFCFAPGPVHRVPRHWTALWICCHTSDDMARVWVARRRPLVARRGCWLTDFQYSLRSWTDTAAVAANARILAGMV